MPEKGEGLHRLSSKSGKPTASGRKYQKVIVVAKKSQQVHLQTSGGQGKGWCLFLLSNQPCTEGVTCCGCLISTSLSQLETCQPSAETISTVTEILISSSPDCTSLSLGDVSFYTRHNTPLPFFLHTGQLLELPSVGNWDHPSHPSLSDCPSCLHSLVCQRG